MTEEPEKNQRSTLAEYLHTLGERRVFGTAAIYVPAVWLAVEIASFVLEFVNGPDWVLRLLIAMAAGGFPVAMYLAWVFDVTKDGIVRTGGVFRATPVVLILSVVVLAAATWGMWTLLEPRQVAVAAGPCVPKEPGEPPYLASVGVLPFRFLSASAADANIAEGFTEEVRSMLSRVESFCVPGRIARSAIETTRDDMRAVGEYLNVEYVLDGNVQQEGDTIKVTAELVNASSGLLEWSETYDGTNMSLFDMQGEISRGVIGATRPTVVEDIERLIEARPVTADDSHYLFLLGRYYFYQYGIDSIDRAIELYLQAIEIDDRNPIMYAELSKAYMHNLQVLDASLVGDRYEKAGQALDMAVSLNADLAPVQTAISKHSDDPLVKIPALLRALELEPNYPEALDWLSQQAADVRDFRCGMAADPGLASQYPDEAAFVETVPPILLDPLALVEKAHRLDPYNVTVIANLADEYREAGRAAEALELLERSIRSIPNSAVLLTTLGRHLGDSGRLVERVQRLQQALALDMNPWRMMWLIIAYFELGDNDAAATWVEYVVPAGGFHSIDPNLRFFIALQTGELAEYLVYLDERWPDVKNERGRAYLYTGRIQEGIDLIRPVVDAQQGSELYLHMMANELAWAYLELGQAAQVREVLSRVLVKPDLSPECGGNLNDASMLHVMSLALLGEWDLARSTMSQVLDSGQLSVMPRYYHGYDYLKKDPELWQLAGRYIEAADKEQARWMRIRKTEFLDPASVAGNLSVR